MDLGEGIIGVGSDLVAAGLTLGRTIILAGASTLDRVEINLGIAKLRPVGPPSCQPQDSPQPEPDSTENVDVTVFLLKPKAIHPFNRLCDLLSMKDKEGTDMQTVDKVVEDYANRVVEELRSHLEKSEQPRSSNALLDQVHDTLKKALDVRDFIMS